MLETVRSWLNGTREYNTGIAIFSLLSGDKKLALYFSLGKTSASYTRLQEELKLICDQLKKEDKLPTPSGSSSPIIEKKKSKPQVLNKEPEESTKNDTDLYLCCKRAADDVYKAVMNKRAVLFSMIPGNEMEDPNRADLITSRKSLALEVVQMYNDASRLYDKADFVKVNGRLPGDIEPSGDKYENLKDHEVKQALDSLRKNILKIEKRPQTPDRIALLMKHNEDYAKLNARWLLLKMKG